MSSDSFAIPTALATYGYPEAEPLSLNDAHEEQPSRVTATILAWSEEGKTATAPHENIIMEAYCAKCKMKRKMLAAVEVNSKDGRQAVRGTCAVCGSNLHRFGRITQQTLT